MNTQELTQAIKSEALRLGFQAVGVASASSLHHRRQELAAWISGKLTGRLHYMETFFKRQARFLGDLPDTRSVVVLIASYSNSNGPAVSLQNERKSGRIARYAQGLDYHRVITRRLRELQSFVGKLTPMPAQCALCVDTNPIQERVLAEAAGLGFFGKNTCLIQPRGGSFSFLAALLTNLELIPDEPIQWDCGACTLCLQACPTQAFTQAYELDAGRCISYLTIELRDDMEPTLRPLMGDWLFGCDVCQEVCPYNRKEQPGAVWKEFQPSAGTGAQFPLEELLRCRTQEQFVERFSGTPLMRAKRTGLLRNAAVVAGNLRDPDLVPVLTESLTEDPSALVRRHCAWALGKIGTQEAFTALFARRTKESDPSVLSEIQTTLHGLQSTGA